MNDAERLAIAAVWIWLGMVLAISFLEAPLKFRAHDLEIQVGLAIGRIVFRALNAVKIGWAAIVTICLVIDNPPTSTVVVATVTGAVLVALEVVKAAALVALGIRLLTD